MPYGQFSRYPAICDVHFGQRIERHDQVLPQSVMQPVRQSTLAVLRYPVWPDTSVLCQVSACVVDGVRKALHHLVTEVFSDFILTG
ncbi:hypothetical protein BAY61_01385 [Prauserella marina]|nr:hypothetical protein BAY61_01385 [Prauserella marina]